MSRRDTIIIAVLLNAALLVILFMTALRTDSTPTLAKNELQVEQIPAPVKAAEVVARPPQPPAKNTVDTIDEVLNKYSEVLSQAAEAPKPVETKKEEPVRAEVKNQPVAVAKLPHEESTKTITVAKGDVLEKIARAHGVSVDSIMKENRLTSSHLRIGQKLSIPKATAKKAAPKVEKKTQAKFYVVKGGDSLWSISKKNNIQVEDLLRLNNMDETKAKKLRPGDRLRIE